MSRVSLIKQVDNYSLETQAAKFKQLEEVNGCLIPEEYLIEDEGYQGSDFNRPSIKKVLRWIREGKINAVAFPYLDRFARNLEGGLNLIRTFQEAGAEVLLGEYGWYDSKFKLHVQMGLMIAEAQKDSIQEKSRGGTETKLRNGLAHGGHSPFGWHFVTAAELNYKAMQEGKPLPKKPANIHEPVPGDQEVYRWMGELVLAGHSLRSVCRELLARGIKSPSGKGRWNPTTVLSILQNPCYYTGMWYWGKRESVAIDPKDYRKKNIERHRVKDGWKPRPESEWIGQPLKGGPVISEDKWLAIQAAIQRNKGTKVGKPAKAEGYNAILKGLVKCGCPECGRAIAPWQKVRPKVGVRCWYKCTNRDRLMGNHLCDAESVKAEVLEGAIWDALVSSLTNDLDSLVKKHQEEDRSSQDEEELAGLLANEGRVVGKLKEAVKGAINSDAPEEKEQYRELVEEYKEELKLLRRRIAAAREDGEEVVVDSASIVHAIRKVCGTQDRGVQRRTLCNFVEVIHYYKGSAVMTLRVPLAVAGEGANCQSAEPQINNYISLKVKVSIAA